MKRALKIFVSLILCLSVILSFASCQYVDELLKKYNSDKKVNEEQKHTHTDRKGYTGGLMTDPCFREVYGIYWLETYDEVLETVELLKSHGTEIPQTPIFNCEEYGLDMKICITFSKNKSEKLVDGKNYFDRKLDILGIHSFVFFEDITIEELEYTYYSFYECVKVRHRRSHIDDPEGATDIDIYHKVSSESVHVYYNGSVQFFLDAFRLDSEMTEEQIKILEETIEIIE